MQRVRALVELVRLDSAILGWLSVFVPLFSRTGDSWYSAGQALPIFLICMATFVANDLDDVSRDVINHPARPLPSHRVSERLATLIFFGCLASALFATKHIIDERLAFWYYGLTVASVTYGYIVDSLAPLKVLYVAACAVVPILIVSRLFPDEPTLPTVAIALFLATTGREVCMDLRDRRGDDASFMHQLDAKQVAISAIAVQLAGLVLLSTVTGSSVQLGALAAMTTAVASAARYWFRNRRRIAIALMKVHIALGLAYLI